ncbi:MAG: HAMP domain-containing sensor histidine kinase [Campylobacterota bacterium]|nr:HAMP domain-containing sensor histidine kinase [Campylobacterota bacterium]
MDIDLKYRVKLNTLVALFFIFITIVVAVGLFMQYDISKNIIIENFKLHVDSPQNASLKLQDDISKLKFYCFNIFTLTLTALTIMYIFIYFNVTNALSKITKNIKNQDILDEDRVLINELFVLSSSYNKMHSALRNEINQNEILLDDNRRFIADTIHQIRTPLSVIMMNSDLIKIHQRDSETNDFVEQINASINMLSNSYEDLAYITSHNGTLEYKATNLNLSAILEKRVDFFKTIAKVNSKKLSRNIEESVFYNINQIEFERIVDNNISNAIKYASSGLQIRVELLQVNGKIKLSFHSFGSPIQNPDKLFDKNYRENSAKRGYGIGLNMVSGICKKYGVKYEVTYHGGQNIFTYIF